MYVRVYAPNGEPFDVSRDRADHLLLNCGWTQAPTEPAPEADEDFGKTMRRRRKSADADDITATADAGEASVVSDAE